MSYLLFKGANVLYEIVDFFLRCVYNQTFEYILFALFCECGNNMSCQTFIVVVFAQLFDALMRYISNSHYHLVQLGLSIQNFISYYQNHMDINRNRKKIISISTCLLYSLLSC